MTSKKIVLDTSVILHDSNCIYNFEDNDIIIPMVVLESVDNFKKGTSSKNYEASNFIRVLSELNIDELINGGMSLGPYKGKLLIKLDKAIEATILNEFRNSNKADMHILNQVLVLSKEYPDDTIILVSTNINLRIKAKSIGIRAENYRSDMVDNIDALYEGYTYIEHPGIGDLYGDRSMSADLVDYKFRSNEYAVLRDASTSVLAKYAARTNTLDFISSANAYGITPKNVEQTFALNACMDSNIPLVTLSGKAGTGKTLIALASAIERRQDCHRILLTRPLISLSNKDMGYLPGDIDSKIRPHMTALYDNLDVIKDRLNNDSKAYKTLIKMEAEGKMLLEPLAYIRGRSLIKTIMIIDEAQNLTPLEVKTIITRAGFCTKLIFTGDIYQIDNLYVDIRTNGLSNLIDKMKGQSLYAHVDLKKGERSDLAELASNVL